MSNIVKVEFTREEALACLIRLENSKKTYHWQDQALVKLLNAMGLKPRG